MAKEKKYSIPIYEDGVKTKWNVEGIIGDDKWKQLVKMSPDKKLPDMINMGTKKPPKE